MKVIVFINKQTQEKEYMYDIQTDIIQQFAANEEWYRGTDNDIPENIDKETIDLDIIYNNLVNDKIRQKYSLSEELSLLRQRDKKQKEFDIYDDYCEQAKQQAQKIIQQCKGQ